MAVLMSLFDFNEFIRYLALMEAAVEGLAWGHNKWKALISVEWAEKKCHSSWLASSCAPLWVAVTRTVEPGVLVPLAEQPNGPLSGQRPGVDGASARSAVQDCECLSAAWLLNNLLEYREPHPYMTPHSEEGCGGTPGGTQTRTHSSNR